MAVGDYLFDGEQPPPILLKALNYERWGIGDIMQLPAGLLSRINISLNYYHAISGYLSAKKVTQWTSNNPEAWDIVSWVINQRMERKRGNSDQ
jgi:hypothetical protein